MWVDKLLYYDYRIGQQVGYHDKNPSNRRACRLQQDPQCDHALTRQHRNAGTHDIYAVQAGKGQAKAKATRAGHAKPPEDMLPGRAESDEAMGGVQG